MKKLLLNLFVLGSFGIANAQIIFNVESPAGIAGGYGFTYADPASAWSVPDMTNPANAILDTLALAMDATSADSLCCANSVMPNVAGKIALLYRGSCQFGTKAFNAQAAGAIAVVIINNAPGAPIGMNGGTDGVNVNIPVVMISMADGAIIRAAIENGDDVVAFIGSKLGYFGDDLAIKNDSYLIAPYSSNLQLTSANASEFSVDLGTWVYNFGSNAQMGITVTADITMGSSLFNETSAPFDLNPGDSMYVGFNTFAQSSYPNGNYMGSYTINSPNTDEEPSDNIINFNFLLDNNWIGLVQLDGTTKEPVNKSGIRPANNNTSYTSCIAYRDANASRLAAQGIAFSASVFDANDTSATLDGEFVEVILYQWDDVFTDLNDAGAAVTNINTIASADKTFTAAEEDQHIFVAFDEAVVLADNQRYLFCVKTFTNTVFFGHDDTYSYDRNVDNYLQPLSVLESDGTWNVVGFAGSYPAHTVRFVPAAAVGVEENTVEVNAYPNPAQNQITIPLNGLTGNASLSVYDVNGQLVETVQVTLANQLVYATDKLANGIYQFDMNMENGKTAKFRVVVAK